MNFSFNTPTTTAASTEFSFGGAPGAATNTSASGFAFGGAPVGTAAPGASAPGFGGFGGAAAPVAQSAGTGFSFSTPAAAPQATQAGGTGFSFGGNLSTPAPAATGGLSFGGAPATSTAAPSFSFAPTATPVATGAATTSAPSFFAASTPLAAPTSTAPAASGAPGTTLFGAPAATTATSAAPPAFGAATGTGFGLSTFGGTPVGATTTSAPGLSFGAPAATTAAAAPLTLTLSTTTTDSKAAGQQMTFTQLEENINKWTLELEELEKLFLNQATQVNAWDKVLLSNGDKIVALNDAVEKAKAEQDALEQELEFIGAQHTELEDCIVPLETELAKIPQVDIERGQTYLLAETLDYQLKQMSDDLKEVIEHLNEANKFADPNDPMVQIGKILNAHMNSLQWIDSTTNTISQKLDDIQKMHDTIRKDNERSFRLTYYDS